jgi:glycosyltransferase involved in cell wall biosynthesis
MLFGNDPATRGGAEEHMLMLARALRRDSFRVVLACPPAVLDKLGADIPSDVAAEPIEYYSPTDIKGARQLASSLRRHEIDILHSHMFHASMVASPLGRLCRVPVIIETPHVREHWRRGWKRSYFVDRLIARMVDAYIAVSEANAGYLAGEKRLPASKIRTIQNGIDTERFCPKRGEPGELRNTFGLAEFDSVIAVLARLEPQKGHALLLDALSTVRKQFPRVGVVLLGEGSLREPLEEQARSLDLARNINFAGFQRNIPDWLAASDFTVLPSLYEGLPLAAMESLAMAKPVIASAVDGTPEVVLHGRTGLLVPPGNASALARAMCRLLGDREWTGQLGITGRKWILDHFSIGRQIRETEALYFEAIKKKVRVRATADPVEAKLV